MAKACYAEYVNHCLRFYARHNQPVYKSKADELNWLACERVLNNHTDEEKNLIIEIYSDDSPRLADTICTISAGMNVKTSRLWSLVSNVSREIALERGLL